jgi:PTS system N-acetylgalactosamine-specific IIA component
MISIIVSGHGHFATGLVGAATQIFGPMAQVVAVDFPPEASTEQLDAQLRTVVAALPQADGIVFLTDLLGGSPFKLASAISVASGNMDVVAGANLQMFADVVLERDGISNLDEFAGRAVIGGRNGISSLNERLRRQQAKAAQAAPTDGI